MREQIELLEDHADAGSPVAMVSFPSVMVADVESSVADEQAARDTNSALAPTSAPRRRRRCEADMVLLRKK